MKVIKIDSMITLHQGVTPDEGKPINEEIRKCIELKELVEIDFSGVELMTTAFLNIVIGDLYKDYSSDTLKSMLKITNVEVGDARRIKKVTDTAKLFYGNEEAFNKNVDDTLNGKA